MTVTWKRTTEERYWEMLGVLPPACQTAIGFLVGEARDHNAQGQPRFAAFVGLGDEFYEAIEPMTIADFKRTNGGDVLKGVKP